MQLTAMVDLYCIMDSWLSYKIDGHIKHIHRKIGNYCCHSRKQAQLLILTTAMFSPFTAYEWNTEAVMAAFESISPFNQRTVFLPIPDEKPDLPCKKLYGCHNLKQVSLFQQKGE